MIRARLYSGAVEREAAKESVREWGLDTRRKVNLARWTPIYASGVTVRTDPVLVVKNYISEFLATHQA